MIRVVFSNGGAGTNVGLSVSWVNISVSERRLSQGGARMFARPWDFRRRASQRGISAGRGGRRGLWGRPAPALPLLSWT